MEETKLWNYVHPYHMAEGNFYKGGRAYEYDSWDLFLDSWANEHGMTEDVDYDRIHRWDFQEDCDEDGVEEIVVTLFYVLQRKADLASCRVKVEKEDHDRIREFLKPHAVLNAKLWAGVLYQTTLRSPHAIQSL
jgi:hypothetical protein